MVVSSTWNRLVNGDENAFGTVGLRMFGTGGMRMYRKRRYFPGAPKSAELTSNPSHPGSIKRQSGARIEAKLIRSSSLSRTSNFNFSSRQYLFSQEVNLQTNA
jgi:hypothetical protein